MRALELLGDSVVLADYLWTVEPAAVWGAKGGKVTAKRGPEYFRQDRGHAEDEGRGEAKERKLLVGRCGGCFVLRWYFLTICNLL